MPVRFLPERGREDEILDMIRAHDRQERMMPRQKMDPRGHRIEPPPAERLSIGGKTGAPNATSGAHGLYVAAIFLQELAAMVSTEWMDQLLHNLGRDAEERARNKLGMYQPPENILGYQFPGWEQLSEKYKTWKMAKVGMENPGILRGMMQSSIRSYVMPQVNEVVIGTSEDYAYWFELGTRSMQPRPFLAPAVLEAVRDWTRLAYKEGFLETGAEYEGMAEIGSVGDETVRFTQGPMAEAVAELKRVMAGENIPGAERTRQFMPVVVERVFPGVEDWRWPHGVPERDLPPLTGYMVGRIPEKGGWKDYQSYIRMVREAGHRDPLESLETISPEEMDVMRHGPEDEDIDF